MEQVKQEGQPTRGTRMKKYIIIIAIAVAVIGIAGVATYAVITTVMPKETKSEQPVSTKERAVAADAKAKKLMDEVAKLGNGKESDQKTQQAIDKFNEASRLYAEAGDKDASLQAKANADMLASRLAAEAEYKAKIEAEREAESAQMKADQESTASSDGQ